MSLAFVHWSLHYHYCLFLVRFPFSLPIKFFYPYSEKYLRATTVCAAKGKIYGQFCFFFSTVFCVFPSPRYPQSSFRHSCHHWVVCGSRSCLRVAKYNCTNSPEHNAGTYQLQRNSKLMSTFASLGMPLFLLLHQTPRCYNSYSEVLKAKG